VAARHSTIVTTKANGNKQRKDTESVFEDERARLLNPVDRISEILFGLIMAVTIVGSMSIATAGKEEVRTVMLAALGCNLAWGLVDAVMYVVRTATERTRNRVLARRVADADAGMARRLITQALPEHVVALTGPDEIDGMRRRLLASPDKLRPVLAPRDFLEAFAVFVMVVVATFPVAAPFLLTTDAAKAMRMAQVVTLGMLFMAGFALGRYAGYAKPLRAGLGSAVFGALLIAIVKALGG
jgi:VIT1/CCC1 family predicted Fe2+/Mn2+ transporter